MALQRGAGAVFTGLGAIATYRYQVVKSREGKLPTQPLPVFQHASNTTKKEDQPPREKVVIIGAGVVGVCTAYKLAQKGHQVVVLEPMPQPGEECSHCAAGGMSRQNVVVDKDTWISVLKCLAPSLISKWVLGVPNNDDFQFFHIDWVSSLSDPFFLRWATTFTKTSIFPCEDQKAKQQEMLQFTKFAVQDMVNLLENKRDSMSKVAGYNQCGSLAVSYDDPPTTSIANPSKMSYEPNRVVVGTDAVVKEEPSLAFQELPPKWAKFEYEAKAASSGRFAKELARRCEQDPKLDVTFYYDTKVQGITTTKEAHSNRKPRISELRTNRGIISIPDGVHVVVAAGAWVPHVLALMDLYAPVYPLKGYAMSVSAQETLQANPKLRPQDLPSRIVCDKFMYTTRLGDEIRITSIGEFSEWNTKPTPHVDDAFRAQAIRQFPQLKPRIAQAKTYCGHRPFVSDGILLLGAADTHERLYVTCGPGSNGWKLAMGSGDIIARLVSGQTTNDIKDELGFDASAFSPAGRVLNAPIFAKICRARWNI